MAFLLNEFMAARAKKGYTTNSQLLEAYNKRFQCMSAQTLSYKLRGHSDWTRQEIVNMADLLDLSKKSMNQIFFAD